MLKLYVDTAGLSHESKNRTSKLTHGRRRFDWSVQLSFIAGHAVLSRPAPRFVALPLFLLLLSAQLNLFFWLIQILRLGIDLCSESISFRKTSEKSKLHVVLLHYDGKSRIALLALIIT